MPQKLIIWMMSGIIAGLVSLGAYIGVEVSPAVAGLEVQATHAQHDTDKVAKQLELIRSELNEVNIKLARIEAKL